MKENGIPKFTPQQAQALITHAESAPLKNLHHGKEISALIGDFIAWYGSVTAPPAPPKDEPAP